MLKHSYFDKITKNYQKTLLSTLKEFVRINSQYDETTQSPENPFGKGVSDALNFIANLAERDGFTVNNYGNKVVEILYGTGEKNVTIMAHADVVPEGTGWHVEPFDTTIIKKVIYGRGVADDKGPLLSCYYALKALKENSALPENCQYRFLVGGNEERGSLGMDYYFHKLKKPQPTLGFSPDSDFPLIFAEKGIMNFEVNGKIDLPELISITGGVASNSVIEKCEIKVSLDEKFIRYICDNYSQKEAKIHTEDDITTVVFTGKSAHGAMPELGINAGYMAIKCLAGYYKNEKLILLSKLLSKLDGSSFNAYSSSREMGHNSSNLGLISLNNSKFSATVNFRYVETCDKNELLNNIREAFKPFEIKVVSESPLLFYAKDSSLISTLLSAYQDETGDFKSKPLAIGGGTYAKEADNVVAFGMQFPGWESNMHSPGESVKISDLYKGMSVFARAICYLGKKVNEN